jgi:hypothetical protein
MNGERSQVVKAVVCGTTIRGFNSHRSPYCILLNQTLINLVKANRLSVTVTNKSKFSQVGQKSKNIPTTKVNRKKEKVL